MLRGIHKLCEKGSWKDAVFSLEQDESARKAASRVGGWGEWTPLRKFKKIRVLRFSIPFSLLSVC